MRNAMCGVRGAAPSGDRFEPNHQLSSAPSVGTAGKLSLPDLSIHHPADEDWFHFRGGAAPCPGVGGRRS